MISAIVHVCICYVYVCICSACHGAATKRMHGDDSSWGAGNGRSVTAAAAGTAEGDAMAHGKPAWHGAEGVWDTRDGRC